MIKIYTKLKDLREDNDLTQKECAKIAFISKNSYIRYEKGERTPTLDVIIEFAKYYNVSIDYIAGLITYKRPLYEDKQQTKNVVNIKNINNANFDLK